MSHSADLDRKVLAAVERLGRALRAARQDVATRHEVSLLGLSVIETLADGRPRRVGDLAAELDVSQPRCSPQVPAPTLTGPPRCGSCWVRSPDCRRPG